MPEHPTDEYQRYRREWMENPKHFIVRDFPLHLDIEATNRCNLRCTFCDKLPYWTKDQMGDMDMELYRKIINEASEHKLYGVKLSYRGEPLLHKHIVEMVRYAKENGVLDVYFNTNAMLLKKSISEKFIDAGLDRISVSIEGTDPVAFENARIGAKFDVIKSNISDLLSLRKKKHVNNPKIRIQTVVLDQINLEKYSEYWKDYCDEVAAVDYKDSKNRKKGIFADWACPQLWQRMTIEWDGSIFPCNNDDLRLLKLGNVKERSIYECWHDERVEKLRGIHKNLNSEQIEACNGCPWRTAQILKIK